MLSNNGFRLPEANLLWLFDTDEEQSVVVRKIASFLAARQAALASEAGGLFDVIFYYVGHGGFDTGSASTYFLALRQTNNIDALSSSLAVSSLKRALRESTRDVRHYLILDCCFAAAALAPYLQLSAAAQGMVVQIQDAFPPSGTALLCASGAIVPAKAKRGATFTMFSEALLEVLRLGVPQGGDQLSLAEIGVAVRSLLTSRYGDEAARPEVHSPEQSKGSVAEVPLFRNAEKIENRPEKIALAGVKTGGRESNVADNPDQTLKDLFREFDDTDIPAQIPSYTISESEWSDIPQNVRRMLKQLEGVQPRIIERLVPAAMAIAVITSPLVLLSIHLEKSGTVDVRVGTPLYYAVWAILCMDALSAFVLSCFLLFCGALWRWGERIDNRITLRALEPRSLLWETFDVMKLLRRPRNLVRLGRLPFRRSWIAEYSRWALVPWLLGTGTMVYVLTLMLGH